MADRSAEKKSEISQPGLGCKETKQSGSSSRLEARGDNIKLELVPGVEKISKLERTSSKQQVKSGKVDLTFIEERDVKMSWKLTTLEYFNQEKFPLRKYN